MALQGEVVIVTGSSGLIGSALIPVLAEHYRVVGFDSERPPHPPPEAECVCIDLGSDSQVDAAFKRIRAGYGNRIASVVHLAAYYDFSGAPSRKYEEVTVQGTGRLLRNLRNFEVEQFLFSSTMLVHRAGRPGDRITEDTPREPTWPYPASKVKTEDLIHREHGTIPALILRIAGVYDDVGHSPPITNQIRRIYEGELTARFYPGDLAAGQAFVHLDDVVEAIRLAVTRRAHLPGEAALLIGEPETLGYEEVQRSVARLLGQPQWRTRRMPKLAGKVGASLLSHGPWRDPFIRPWMVDRADDHYELDVSKARDLLRWSTSRSLRESLPVIVDALRRDPARWYAANKFKLPRRIPLPPTGRRTQREAHVR